MIIRDAIEKDLPFILQIMNDAIVHTTAIYDYYPRPEEWIKTWFRQKEKDGLPVLVCEEEGAVRGYGSYGIFRPWDAYQYSAEHSLYILPQCQGKGFGGKLLEALIHRAAAQGFHTLIAGIDAENTASCALHKKFGFTEVGRFEEVGFKFNKWLHLVFMQRFLK